MKFSSGTYGKDTLESNSFVANLLKYPEIASVLISQYPQYAGAYMDGLGRYGKEQIIGANKFQWAVLGRTDRPSTCTGTATGTGVGLTQFSVEFEENYFNPNDVIRFASGAQAIVQGEPTVTAGGYTFQLKWQSTDTALALAATDYVTGVTVGKSSTAFGEGSKGGYQTHVFPDWYTNYLGIQRKAYNITGSALTDVTWIEHEGSKLWYFTDEVIQRNAFMRECEIADWYHTSTIDVNGNPTVIGTDGVPIINGDGILRQIDAANNDTYSGTLTEQMLTDFMAQLSLNTGSQDAQWLVFTGTAGRLAFNNAMKNFVMPGGNLIYNALTGKNQEIGVNFNSYNVMGAKMTVVWNPIFDDPNLHGSNIDLATGYPKESFRMVFLNVGQTNGVANLERKVKGAEGMNRSMLIRYIPGMIDPFNQKTMTASNSSDSFGVEYLREAGIIIRNPLSCGQLILA